MIGTAPGVAAKRPRLGVTGNPNFTAAGTPRLSASNEDRTMKKKTGGKPTMERDQGKPKGRASGVNKPMVKESVPQVVARNTYGRPTQTQKM